MGFYQKKYEERFLVNPLHDYREQYQNAQGLFTYRRMVDWNECPHLKAEDKLVARQAILEKYGKDSAFAKSMLFGQFQRADDYSLIYTDEDIEMMRDAMRGDCEPIGSDVSAASDTSGGGDAQPLMVRIGTDVLFQEKARVGMTGIEHAEHLVERLGYLNINPWDFTIDGGGIGAEVANYMETRLDYNGIKRAQANVGPKFKHEYRDKYTETHFLLKELLSAKVLRLRWNEDLLKQMRCRRFVEMEVGLKIKTEPKPAHRKREKSSPDDLDTLVYLFYDFDWTLLHTIAAPEKRAVSENSPTQIEKDADRLSVKGHAFAGLRDMTAARGRFQADMRRQSLRIGR